MHLAGEEKRRAPREATRLDAVLVNDERAPVRCTILDINAYGARLDMGEGEAPEAFHLIDVASAVAYRARVVWRQAPLVGTRFLETWSLNAPNAPQWLKDVRGETLRADGLQRGIRLVWSAKDSQQDTAA